MTRSVRKTTRKSAAATETATTNLPWEVPAAAGEAADFDAAVSEFIRGPWLSLQRKAPRAVVAADVCVYYARYSTDKQNKNESSVERQIEGSDAYVKFHRLTVRPGGHVFADRGKSGAFLAEREALAALLEAASRGEFNKLLVENLDRLSRNLVDVLEIHRRFKLLGIEIHVTGSGASAGRVDDVDAVFHGMVAMLHRERMMELTGLGRWRAAMRGQNVGSIPYGYRCAGERGMLEIHDEEAAVIRRIFDWFDKGLAPVRIVQALNAEGLPSPKGREWSVTTLLGSSPSAKGILRNPRYVGMFVYGASMCTTTEVDGRKTTVVAARPQEDWVYVAVPEWQIVDKALWARVMLRLKSKKRARKPQDAEPREKKSDRHTLLLHGSYTCRCGSRMKGSFHGLQKARTLVCYGAILKGTCPEGRSVSATSVEIEVLREIRDNVLDPAAMDVFVEDYIRGDRQIAEEAQSRRAALEERIEQLGGFIRQSFEAAEERDVVEARRVWNRERTEHETALEALPTPKAVPNIDPASIASLRESMNTLILRMPFVAGSAQDLVLCAALRRLVPKVVVHRDPGEAGYRLEITVSYAGLAENPAVALEAGLPTSVLWRDCPPPKRGRPNSEEWQAHLREHIENRTFFVCDDDWRATEHVVDEPTFHPPRRLVDAALLALRTGASVESLPAPYGEVTMVNGLRRFVKRGLWRKVYEALETVGSPSVAGLDTSRFAYMERHLDPPPLAEAA